MHHQRLDLHTEPLAPGHRLCDEVGRLLERVGSRQDDHALGGDRSEQAPVELVVGDERAAALQCDGPGHGRRWYAAVDRTDFRQGTQRQKRLDRLPMGNYSEPMGDIQRVGIVGSGIMGAGLAEVVARPAST